MRNLLDDTGPLPFAPGESPFRIKGTVIRGFLDWIARHSPGGIDGLLRAYRDPRLAPFMSQQFLASSFYDILPLVTSAHVAARLGGRSFGEFLRVRSRDQAERDLGGIYRLLLLWTSPANVVQRYAKIQQQYFSFGAARAEQVSHNHAILTREKIPEMLADWFAAVQPPFLEVALPGAGAKNLYTRAETIPDGTTLGLPAATVVLDVTWE